MIRLDKFLAHATNRTRSEVRQYLRAGRVSVNDQVEKKSDRKIEEGKDSVSLDGQYIHRTLGATWYMMNKCSGVVTANTDRHERTVMELLGEEWRKELNCVGRLDKDTEGLLLITDDGQTIHRLISPGRHVDKGYQALVSGKVSEEDCDRFARGLDIGEKRLTLPAGLTVLPDKAFAVPKQILDTLQDMPVTYTEVHIHEGKYHQIKRMFQAIDSTVLFLRRISMGPLCLDSALAPGQYRPLTQKEVELIVGAKQ